MEYVTDTWTQSSIGKPLKGVFYEIDPANSELLISGDGLAREYVKNDALTKKQFFIKVEYGITEQGIESRDILLWNSSLYLKDD